MTGQVCFEEGAVFDAGSLTAQDDASWELLSCVLQGGDDFNETAPCDEMRCDSMSAAHIERRDDRNARQRMLVHSLIVNIARQYADHDAILPELVREGRKGFLYAQQKFEPGCGACFSSYANRCVSRHIERASARRINSIDYFQSRSVHPLSFDNPAHRR